MAKLLWTRTAGDLDVVCDLPAGSLSHGPGAPGEHSLRQSPAEQRVCANRDVRQRTSAILFQQNSSGILLFSYEKEDAAALCDHMNGP